ncbi:MAG TPA: hypothetical protein VN577_07660 [Terriglobales bacterium]|nr:hypothetical protein [Terriglobales bacterium]
MKSNVAIFVLLLGAIAFAVMVSAQDSTVGGKTTSTSAPNGSARQKQAPDAADEGERLFHVHCSRCHDAPQQLSPRAAATVLKHMRVRASLSQETEKLILDYIRP